MRPHDDTLFQKLCVILHRSLVEARNLSLGGQHQQLYDLVDAFEIVPSLMMAWRDENLAQVRAILSDYQTKHPQTAYDYLSILDMDSAEFVAVYQPDVPQQV